MDNTVDFFIDKFRKNLDRAPEQGRYFRPRPYRNASVRFRECSIGDFEKRKEALISEAGLNPFLFRSDMIPGCDLLSDSGTTTMTVKQWVAMLLGDEAYGSNEGYFELKDQVAETFGEDWRSSPGLNGENIFIFHQGRAAENALFSILRKVLKVHSGGELSGGLNPELRERISSVMSSLEQPERESAYIIPSNSHFDTTEGNILDKKMIPLNLPCREHIEGNEGCGFRGNMDTGKLENLLENESGRVPLVYLTITNNTGGGQPVSISNIREVKDMADKYQVPLFLDACRFAENSWFIKKREPGYSDKSITAIVHEMFSYVDGFHISLKKDGLVNMGGALVLKNGARFDSAYPDFKQRVIDHQIMTEGHPTYGGLTGRDLKGVVEGLKTVVRDSYLASRVGQVERLGMQLDGYGIPIIKPVGGHAVYMDMDRFFGAEGRDEFMGISLTALLLIAGHRVCELGIYAFGHFDGEEEVPPHPRVNYVRAAVPRLCYEDQDLSAFVESVKILYDHRDRIPGVNVEFGRELPLRHFKSRFSFK
ncbi:MAG: tryptophanase [Candidatus Krumholzibacteriales bacterium]